MNFRVFGDGLGDRFGLHACAVAAVDIAEGAQINARQQAMGRQIVGVALQNFVGFADRFADALSKVTAYGFWRSQSSNEARYSTIPLREYSRWPSLRN